ncbi:calcineurin-like phosphoesterase [Thraustotheca clavata]|uniref:Calcineurin-like phosphoesterase n=1 Tax=Thraustotheca clavata TaxID=74557 RepID=A0A1V9YIV2_9STRA|nr:calcineurin-like phosphoesterase [Thraustotheca clavata]
MNFYGKVAPNAAVMNGGGIRSNKKRPAGSVTVSDVISWDPFGNIITVIEADGVSLKKFLQYELVQSCGATSVISSSFYTYNAGSYFHYVCQGLNKGELKKLTRNNANGTSIEDSDKVILAISDYWETTFRQAGGTAKFIINPKGAPSNVLLEAYIDSNKGDICPSTTSYNFV